MSIKLLPASVNPLDPSHPLDVATGLVPLIQRAITTRAGQPIPVSSADGFSWSSAARRGEPQFIHGTPVDDSPSDDSQPSAWEYVSAWAWNHLVESTVIAHYRTYSAAPATWSGRLINLYA